MRAALLLILILVSCGTADEAAVKHLASSGYHSPQCEKDGRDESACTALDDHGERLRFHCVTYDAPGCADGPKTACEQYYTERPAR